MSSSRILLTPRTQSFLQSREPPGSALGPTNHHRTLLGTIYVLPPRPSLVETPVLLPNNSKLSQSLSVRASLTDSTTYVYLPEFPSPATPRPGWDYGRDYQI